MKLAFITLCVWAVVVLVAEGLWRKHLLKGEYARKFTHILLSVSIAFLPYYLPWNLIKVVGLAGLAAVICMRVTGLFGSIYDIKRRTWGDIIGPAAIVALVFFEPPRLLFALAVLHTGLADGMAAIVGTRFGKKNGYKVLGYKKSIAGTIAFYVTSLGITAGILAAGSPANPLAALLVIPLVTTLVENISPYGIDNALIVMAASGLCVAVQIG